MVTSGYMVHLHRYI